MKLYVTYCAGNKHDGVHTPENLYISDRIARFISRCKVLGVDWAILSALHALIFPEDEVAKYNVTMRTDPSYWLGVAIVKDGVKISRKDSKDHVEALARKIGEQAYLHNVDRIVFYGPSPKMMRCYLALLHLAFDGCDLNHGWKELVRHVGDSIILRAINRLEEMSPQNRRTSNRYNNDLLEPPSRNLIVHKTCH